MAKRKRTNNDLQNITQKTKDRVTRTPLTTGGEHQNTRFCAKLLVKSMWIGIHLILISTCTCIART
jgi:hypothetical protein